MNPYDNLTKRLHEMQSRIADVQASMEKTELVAEAGGGLVQVVVSGTGRVKKVRIDPSVVDRNDVGVLEDLITAACRAAHEKSDAHQKKVMANTTSQFSFPFGQGAS